MFDMSLTAKAQRELDLLQVWKCGMAWLVSPYGRHELGGNGGMMRTWLGVEVWTRGCVEGTNFSGARPVPAAPVGRTAWSHLCEPTHLHAAARTPTRILMLARP